MTTRLAVIADVHADLASLRMALATIERMRCDLVVCAGDLVDYGVFPEETIALIRDRGIPCVRGNHDRWALGNTGPTEAFGESRHYDASGWDLSPAALQFLSELPLTWEATLDGVRVILCHGDPRSDMAVIHPDHTPAANLRRTLDRADADVLLCGHTHMPFTIHLDGSRLVACPGALGTCLGDEPRATLLDGSRRLVGPRDCEAGTFGVLDLPRRTFTVHRAGDGSEIVIQRRLT
jgi:putative phosphoesterase